MYNMVVTYNPRTSLKFHTSNCLGHETVVAISFPVIFTNESNMLVIFEGEQSLGKQVPTDKPADPSWNCKKTGIKVCLLT